MTEAGRKIASEIAASGPIPFSRFMEIALYDNEHGYYRRPHVDPFGKQGDFFTASQMQPMFGRLVAAAIRAWKQEMTAGEEFTVVEWGAGRGDMAEAFSGFRYVAVDAGRGEPPEQYSGVVFSNELFDALPVDVARRQDGVWRERRVALDGERFVWTDGPRLPAAPIELQGLEEFDSLEVEVPVKMDGVLQSMVAGLTRGYVLTIDYGMSERERIRFTNGTLMSYRRHQASEDVLRDPGEQDITAHVPFDLLMHSAQRLGLELLRFETMSKWLLSLGESAMEKALEAENESERQHLRLQLKTLLVGMGETFRVAAWRRP